MNISYAVTVHNEVEELKKLLIVLTTYKRDEDEIVILMDETVTDDVVNLCKGHEYSKHALNKDFAVHKNHLNSLCRGDYIFQLDADEFPSILLVQQLPAILEMNEDIDLILIPRVNTVEGLTGAHIKQWGWRVNSREWVNWPDYQSRIYRNKPEIQWTNKVHEKIVGYDRYTNLPEHEDYCIYHPKTIDRQEIQNQLYQEITMGF